MILASILGMFFTTVGLWLSYSFNLSSGATIILVAGAVYLLSGAVRFLMRHIHPQEITQSHSGEIGMLPKQLPNRGKFSSQNKRI